MIGDKRIRHLTQVATLNYIPTSDYGKNGDKVYVKDGKTNSTEEFIKQDGSWVSLLTGRGANDGKRRAGKKGISSASATTIQNITVNEAESTGTGGTVTSHYELTELDDDDHSQYVHNTIARTVSAGHTFSGNPAFSGQPSFTKTGTPFTVTGTTKVANLNVDKVDDKQPGTGVGDIAYYDSNNRVADSQLVDGKQPGTSVADIAYYDGNARVVDSDKWDGYQFSDYLNQDVKSTAAPTFATVNTGQGANELYAMNQDVETTDAVTFATVNTGQGANELYDMDQNVLSTSAVTFATVNTGQGANELYDMDQNVLSTSAVTFATVNTGQGANELYDMNQNVLTTSSPQFSNMTMGEWSDPNYSNGNIGTAQFASGFTGSGWKIDRSGNEYTFEADNMTIRGTLSVYELLIQQIRATNGSIFVSAAAKVDSVSGSAGSETIVFEDPSDHGVCPFAVGDIIMAQRVRLDSTTLVKRIVRQVYSVNGKTIVVTTTSGGPSDTGGIESGFDFVRLGNVDSTNYANRQGGVYLTADDSNAPFIDVFDGVTSWSQWTGYGKTKARLGKLDGITDTDAGLSGNQSDLYGLYSDDVYLTGHINATSGYIGSTSQGWAISSDKISNGNVKLNANNETIQLGTVTSFANDTNSKSGIFMGKESAGNYDFFVGKETVQYMHWDDSAGSLKVKGHIDATSGSIGGVDIINGSLSISASDIDDVDAYTTDQDIQTLPTNSSFTFDGLGDDSPTGTGFFMDEYKLGYYNSDTWYTYMGKNGDFGLAGTGGSGGGSLTWDSSTSTLTIRGDIEMGSGSTITWGNVTESGTAPYRANNWNPDLSSYATNSALSNYALNSSLSDYMEVTPSSSTNIGSNYVYTGTLIAGQVNAVAINADSISTGTLAAARISAGSLRANKITAGGANLVPSPAIFTSAVSLEAEGWTKASTRTELRWEDDAFAGSTYRCIEVGGYNDSYGSGNQSGNLASPLIPIDTSQTYRLKLDLAQETNAQTDFGIQLRFYTSNGVSEVASSNVNADGDEGSPATGILPFYVASGYITNYSSKWVHIDRVLFPASATQDQMRGGGNLDEQDDASEVGITGHSLYLANNCKMPINAEYVKIFIINQPETYYENIRVANISLTAIGEGFGVITGSKIQTSSTGKRIAIDGDNNKISLYASDGHEYIKIDDDTTYDFTWGGTNVSIPIDDPGIYMTAPDVSSNNPRLSIQTGTAVVRAETMVSATGHKCVAVYASAPRVGTANHYCFNATHLNSDAYNYYGFYADIQNNNISYDDYGIYIANGTCYRGGSSSWDTSSDIRYKENVNQYELGLSEIIQLNPISFNFKDVDE